MFFSVFDSGKLAYGLYVADLYVTIAHPQFGGGAKYEDFLTMLEKKSVVKYRAGKVRLW